MGRDWPCWGGGWRESQRKPPSEHTNKAGLREEGISGDGLQKYDDQSSIENLGSLNKYKEPSMGEGLFRKGG